MASADGVQRRKAERGTVEVRESDVAIEGGEYAALIAGAGGAGKERTAGKKLIRRAKELNGAAAAREETIKAGDAALNDLRGGGGGEDERDSAERDGEADGTADKIIGRGAESGRGRTAGGGKRNLIGLRERGGRERQHYEKEKLFHHAPKKTRDRRRRRECNLNAK